VKGLDTKAANSQAMELIEKLNLSDKKNVLSNFLSGGQKRKLSLGCAIIGGSKVCFLYLM